MQRFSHGSFEKELDNSAAGLTVALQRLKFQAKNKSDKGNFHIIRTGMFSSWK